MVKNPHILEALQREERKREKAGNERKDWYKKADEMYNMALSLNPKLIHSKSEKHLQMLIDVRKKINSISKNS